MLVFLPISRFASKCTLKQIVFLIANFLSGYILSLILEQYKELRCVRTFLPVHYITSMNNASLQESVMQCLEERLKKKSFRCERETWHTCSKRIVQPTKYLIVRRAGLLWSQLDFEWRWSVPLFKCLTVLEFSFILFDLCLLITFFNFIMNYVPIVTFWIFTYHKIWILSIMFCSIWSYWIIYFLACLEVSWRVVS